MTLPLQETTNIAQLNIDHLPTPSSTGASLILRGKPNDAVPALSLTYRKSLRRFTFTEERADYASPNQNKIAHWAPTKTTTSGDKRFNDRARQYV